MEFTLATSWLLSLSASVAKVAVMMEQPDGQVRLTALLLNQRS
tara:strand:- start:1286 stop:1414 length:129 start_codon:yes stop_codon:yes gene_type:complete